MDHRRADEHAWRSAADRAKVTLRGQPDGSLFSRCRGLNLPSGRCIRVMLETNKSGDPTMTEALDDAVRAPEWASPRGWSTSPGGRTAALSVGYVALYLALDRLSFIGALHGIGITPWNPSTGLALALLIVKGPRYAPLVLAADLLSSATLPIEPVPAWPVLLGSLVVTGCYGGAAAILRHAGFRGGIRTSSDAVALLLVTVIASAFVAGGYVVAYAGAGVVPWSGVAEAVYHYWIGDAVGIAVVVPVLLLLHDRIDGRPRPEPGEPRRLLFEFAMQGASIVAALAAVFWGAAGDHSLWQFYLLFLPLIWIATRHGLPAASWAVLVIQIGLIAGLEIQGYSEHLLRAFQLLTFALAATGLMLGAVVSERRRLALALAESEERRAAILNTARDGVLTIDGLGRIQSVNPAVERLFARPSELLLGHDVSELVEDAPDLLQRLRIAACAPVSEVVSWELDARPADGHAFPIEFSAGRFDLIGAEHYVVVIRDVTSRRNAEARDREHQAELARVSRVSLAGEMAAGLAHELSQPLTAIAAYARGCLRLLAAAEPEPALLQEGLAQLLLQAERAGDVLGRLREFVRGDEYRRVATEVGPLIAAVFTLTRAEAVQKQVALEARVDPGLPAVVADRVQIEQVLVNLLRNAMDAMEAANSERRSVVVGARCNEKGAVEIAVTDTGPGVPAEVGDQIFEPFVTTKPDGMGMGLSISHSIVKSHGGILRMDRGASSGAVFLFDLPALETEAGTDAG
jgi:two-component system sensor kinase FixL